MSFEICIKVDDQNQITVGLEPGDQPAAAAPMPPADAGTPAPDDQSNYQPAQDIDQALQMAQQLYTEQSGSDQGADDGNAPLSSPDEAKKVWGQLARQKDKARAQAGAM